MSSYIDSIKEQILSIENKIKELEDLKNSSTSPDMLLLADEDIKSLKKEKEALETSLNAIENTKKTSQSNYSTNSDTVIIEVRAGTGGDEAGLFANELLNMYIRYAEIQKWKVDIVSKNEGGLGNVKEASIEIIGKVSPSPYDKLRYESGVHRVQRVPITDSGGRIHTSTATVAVLPIVKHIQINIKPEHLKIDTFRASGAGGQHVNKTESAIRITHLPTGLVVQCQDERSQHKNKDRAMSILQSKLVEMMNLQQKQSVDEIRSDQVGTAERSEKIKTYNFPQDRITDHRVKISWFGIENVLLGNLDKILTETKQAIESGTTGNAEEE
jgi:peptide chain release factor 1